MPSSVNCHPPKRFRFPSFSFSSFFQGTGLGLPPSTWPNYPQTPPYQCCHRQVISLQAIFIYILMRESVESSLIGSSQQQSLHFTVCFFFGLFLAVPLCKSDALLSDLVPILLWSFPGALRGERRFHWKETNLCFQSLHFLAGSGWLCSLQVPSMFIL